MKKMAANTPSSGRKSVFVHQVAVSGTVSTNEFFSFVVCPLFRIAGECNA